MNKADVVIAGLREEVALLRALARKRYYEIETAWAEIDWQNDEINTLKAELKELRAAAANTIVIRSRSRGDA